MWLELFYDCHEFVPSGTYGMIKGAKGKAKQLGHYHRLEWPYHGGVMSQPNIIVQAFQVINNAIDKNQMQGVEIQG